MVIGDCTITRIIATSINNESALVLFRAVDSLLWLQFDGDSLGFWGNLLV